MEYYIAGALTEAGHEECLVSVCCFCAQSSVDDVPSFCLQPQDFSSVTKFGHDNFPSALSFRDLCLAAQAMPATRDAYDWNNCDVPDACQLTDIDGARDYELCGFVEGKCHHDIEHYVQGALAEGRAFPELIDCLHAVCCFCAGGNSDKAVCAEALYDFTAAGLGHVTLNAVCTLAPVVAPEVAWTRCDGYEYEDECRSTSAASPGFCTYVEDKVRLAAGVGPGHWRWRRCLA